MSQSSVIRSLDDLDVVVDADFHITEQQEDFITYIDDPFDKMLNRGEHEDGSGFLTNLYPSSGLFTPVVTGKAEHPSARTRKEMVEARQMLNTNRGVVTPTQNLYLGMVHHDELAVALASAYNEWLLDEIIDEENGIYGTALVAPQKPEKAAEEIDDRASESGIVGAFIPSGGIRPPLGDESYYPIYEAAEDNGLPVSMHNASGNQMLHFPAQFQDYKRFLSIHATTHAMIHMTHLTTMITRGVPERFPDLDFIFQEAGIGWIPYMMRRLDHEYSAKREDAPMLEQMPSDYIRDQFYFTSQPVEGTDDPKYVQDMVRLFDGETNLMFSSDYPHFDFDHSSALLDVLRAEFDDDEIANIYGETALSVYDF